MNTDTLWTTPNRPSILNDLAVAGFRWQKDKHTHIAHPSKLIWCDFDAHIAEINGLVNGFVWTYIDKDAKRHSNQNFHNIELIIRTINLTMEIDSESYEMFEWIKNETEPILII